MYLKALEIQGFKSFPDKTALTFGEDITVIVGPNGVGKSNISDAIRWVMGEQSTRALRGGKMEDVIFGGTARRQQTGYAEVSLVLDNSSHLFPVEENEVMVTRRYYRSGESEYYINRRSVRLKDVNELFMDTGLGREGYSIIGQGRIDEILSVKSADRREVFEEAAGISRFRHRKEEAQRKLERTQENLVRVNDKISELELQVEPLREQSEKAKQFLLLRDELKVLEISVWLDSLERLRAGSIKLSADYEEAARQQREAKEALERHYAQAEALAGEMRQKDVEMEALRQQAQAGDAAAAELESAVAVLRSSMEHNADNAARLRADLEQQEGREGSLFAQIAQRRARLEELEEQSAGLRRDMGEKEARAQELRRSAGLLAQELETLRQRESMESATAGEARALLSALSAAAQEILDRDEGVRRELSGLEARLEEAREQERQAEKLRREAEEERDGVGNVISGYTLRLEARRKKADSAQERHTRLRMDENALDSRLKLLTEMEKEYEGFHKAVRLVMGEAERGNLRNIHGPVANLLRAPEEYTVAVETALGGAMQHLVVDREEDGKAVIQFLKRRDGGRATILPLSSVQGGPLRERDSVAKEPGFVGIGDELVEFQPQYAGIFSSLLGRVVVMEHLDAAIAAARKYGYRFRIVTLDGQVLNPGGSMTGGSVSRSAGVLSRKSELERLEGQAKELRGQLSQAARELEETQRDFTAAAYELDTAQAQLRRWEDALLKAEGECARCCSVTEGLLEQKAGYEEELRQLQARNGQIEADTAAARDHIRALEGAAAALKDETQDKSQGQTQLQEGLAAVTEEAARLGAALAALEGEGQSVAEGLHQLETLHQDMAGDREQSRGLMEQYEAKNRAMEAEIADKLAELEELRAASAHRREDLRRLGEEKLQLEGRRNQADRGSRDRNQELLAMEREVSLLEQKKVAAALEEKQLLDKLWDSYELSHEGARALRVELESLTKANRRIGELRRGIAALGTVNVGAIEDFRRVNERYTYLTGQRDDVQKAKDELGGLIAEITGEMKAIFAREFQIINQAFGETFAELFNGGKAALELEDPEDILNCGIEIRVQPPGKALKIISLLSGGEKAFVAIALYFAILKVRPTPFVVMDEIEAALDDNNVVRFARYLRGLAQRTQFIVITHRRGTMEEADVLYGVTMQEQGISRMLTINLNDVERQLNIK